MLAAGCLTRRELFARMNARDMAEWEAYERVDGPIGAGRQDELVKFLVQMLLRPHLKNPGEVELPSWWKKSDGDRRLVQDEEAVAARTEEVAAKLDSLFGAKMP